MSDEFKKIENIENALNKPKAKKFGLNLHSLKQNKETDDIKYSWQDRGPVIAPISLEKQGVSLGVKLFFLSVVILVSSLIYTGYRILGERSSVSNNNIDVILTVKPYVEGGEVTPLDINVENRNVVPLQNAVLTISYKKGVSSQNETEEIHEKKTFGTLPKNVVVNDSVDVQLFGAESEAKDITAKLEYQVTGQNAVFSKVVTVSTIIKTPSVSVHIDGPDTLSQGQAGNYSIVVKNNTSTTSLPFTLAVLPPKSFRLDDASPRPSGSDLVWSIDTLKIGESKQFTLLGAFVGDPGEDTTFHATVGAGSPQSKNISVIYSTDVKSVSISSPSLKLSLVNETAGDSSDTIKYGDRESFVLQYENVSDKILNNVSLAAHITGSAPLITSVTDDGQGYYDSIKQIISWNKATLPDLETLAPHAKGSVRFYVPIVSKGINLPNLRVEISALADTNRVGDISSSVSKSWVVKGSAALSAKTLYKTSPFKMTGPVPPRANIETSYDLHLIASTQNMLQSAKVSFVLPIYTTWQNTFTQGQNITYDDKTRTVSWDIGDIPAGKSVVSDILVSVKPSQSHVGKNPPVTSSIVFEGQETGSNSTIRSTLSPLSTTLSSESWSVDTGTVLDR